MKSGYFRLVLFTAIASFLLPYGLKAQTPPSSNDEKGYSDFVKTCLDAKKLSVEHNTTTHLTTIQFVGQFDNDMQMDIDDKSQAIYKEFLVASARVPDHPSAKNPPLAFLSLWSSQADMYHFTDCAEVEMQLDDKGFDYQKMTYTPTTPSAGAYVENFLVTLNGSGLLKMVKAQKVSIQLCTNAYTPLQKQRWVLRWVSERFMETLEKNMGGAKSAKMDSVLAPVGFFKKVKKQEEAPDLLCQYLVTGSGGCDTADVTYRDEAGNTAQESGVSLPWSHDLFVSPDKLSGLFLYISAQNHNDHGSITTEVKENGVTKLGPTTSSGGYVISTTNGHL